MKRLLVRADLCTGCRACAVACVAHHEGCFGVANARVRVTKVEPLGVDLPHVCHSCERPACVAACPEGALRRDDATGVVLLHQEHCIGCSACVSACTYGMVRLHTETGLPLICDLCGGDPACVKRCATGAIVFVEDGAHPVTGQDDLASKAAVQDLGTSTAL